MKEIKYLCDECKKEISNGCVGVNNLAIKPGKEYSSMTVSLNVGNLDTYTLLFHNLLCFSTYFSKLQNRKEVKDEPRT